MAQQGGSDLGDGAAANFVAFVGEGPVFGGDPPGRIKAARWPPDEQPDLVESDLQQPGAEPVLPGAQDCGDRQCVSELVGGRAADQRQDVGLSPVVCVKRLRT